MVKGLTDAYLAHFSSLFSLFHCRGFYYLQCSSSLSQKIKQRIKNLFLVKKRYLVKKLFLVQKFFNDNKQPIIAWSIQVQLSKARFSLVQLSRDRYSQVQPSRANYPQVRPRGEYFSFKAWHFFRFVQKYYYHVQKNCPFLGLCRNITIQGQGVPGEIYTSGSTKYSLVQPSKEK